MVVNHQGEYLTVSTTKIPKRMFLLLPRSLLQQGRSIATALNVNIPMAVVTTAEWFWHLFLLLPKLTANILVAVVTTTE